MAHNTGCKDTGNSALSVLFVMFVIVLQDANCGDTGDSAQSTMFAIVTCNTSDSASSAMYLYSRRSIAGAMRYHITRLLRADTTITAASSAC